MVRTLTAAQLTCNAFHVLRETTLQQFLQQMTMSAIALPAQTTPSQLTTWQAVASPEDITLTMTSLL
jgi:hypothetical protein